MEQHELVDGVASGTGGAAGRREGRASDAVELLEIPLLVEADVAHLSSKCREKRAEPLVSVVELSGDDFETRARERRLIGVERTSRLDTLAQVAMKLRRVDVGDRTSIGWGGQYWILPLAPALKLDECGGLTCARG